MLRRLDGDVGKAASLARWFDALMPGCVRIRANGPEKCAFSCRVTTSDAFCRVVLRSRVVVAFVLVCAVAHIAEAADEERPSSASTANEGKGTTHVFGAAFLLTRAGDAFAQGRFTEAEQLFKSLLKLEPDNEAALIHLSVIAGRRKDRKAAIAYLTTAVKHHPKSFAAQHWLGINLAAAGELKASLAPLTLATELDPKRHDAFLNLADSHMRLAQFDEALKVYDRALELVPDDGYVMRQAGYAAFQRGEPQRAVKLLDGARKHMPNDWNTWLVLGHAQDALGNDGSALEAYEKVMALAPRMGAGYLFSGNMLGRANKTKAAERRYREAIRVEPGDPLVRVLLGNLMRRDGRLIQAQREYEAALRLDGNHIWALTQLGFLLFEKNDVKQAEKLLKKADKLAPNNDDVEITLGDLHALRGRAEEAEIRFKRVLSRSPLNLSALLKLGLSKQKRQKLSEALALYEKASAAHPQSAWAAIALGDCLRALDRKKDAEASYLRALQADPRSTWARRQLGYVRFELGEAEAAVSDLREVEATFPDEIDLPLVIGHGLRQLGQPEEAMAYYRKAAQIDAKSPMPRLFLGVALSQAKRHPEAIDQFQRALAADPNMLDAWMGLGDTASQARAEALTAWESRRVYLAPASDQAVLASSQPASGPSAEEQDTAERMANVARAAYNRARAIKPEDPWPVRQLAFFEFSSGNVALAEELLKTVVAAYPDHVEIALILGHAARERKSFTEARAQYARAVRIAPSDIRPRVFLATALRQLGELIASHQELLQAVQVAPDSAWAHYERALTLFELRRYPQALIAAERATTLNPDHRDGWLFLGNLHHLSHHADASVRAFDEALRLGLDYAPAQIGSASALLHRDRPGDLAEAAARAEKAVAQMPDDAFVRLVAGHVFTRVYTRERLGFDFKGLRDDLRGKDVGVPFDDIAARHLVRALALDSGSHTTRLSAATSFISLERYEAALNSLEPVLRLGQSFCPKREWEVTWSLEGKSADALLVPRSVEEQRLLPSRDRAALAYLLAGDVWLKRKDRKQARLHYACSVGLQPERPEAHIQLGYAYESDAFYRLAEEHYVLAQKLAFLTLDRTSKEQAERAVILPASLPVLEAASQPTAGPASFPASMASVIDAAPSSLPTAADAELTSADPPTPDEARTLELQRLEWLASEGVGRLRKEAGFPITQWLRASAETGFYSDNLGPEYMARLSTLFASRGVDPSLALTVPRTFFTMASVAAKPIQWRAVPRFELAARFFREEGMFWNDRQTIEQRLGVAVTGGAHGVVPLHLADTELRYGLEQTVTFADSPSRGELRSNTFARSRLTHFKLGAVEAQLGYEHGGFTLRMLTPLAQALATDTAANTVYGVARIEPQLKRWGLQAGLEYRTEHTFLAPSGRKFWGHVISTDFSSRIGDWIVSNVNRFAFAGTDFVPEAIPAIFSYMLRVRTARTFANIASIGGSFTLAGTGDGQRIPTEFSAMHRRLFDSVAFGIDANYRLVWPRVPDRVHTGFYVYGSYDLRIAHVSGRIDHIFTVGLSFAR